MGDSDTAICAESVSESLDDVIHELAELFWQDAEAYAIEGGAKYTASEAEQAKANCLKDAKEWARRIREAHSD